MSQTPVTRSPARGAGPFPVTRRGDRDAVGGASSPARRRWRVAGVVAFIVLAVIVATWIAPRLNHAVHDLGLPLADQGIIRAQAAEKHLDPALIAAVIFAETKFYARTSPTGAMGLMQIEPATAADLARMSGGSTFTTSDLDTPAINIAYGSYYLRFLLDHYQGDEMLAVAAYNGGITNVDRWVAAARARGRQLTVSMIPFAQTRAYVTKVLQAQRAYRSRYPTQLGL